jgi:hypothetical protein
MIDPLLKRSIVREDLGCGEMELVKGGADELSSSLPLPETHPC